MRSSFEAPGREDDDDLHARLGPRATGDQEPDRPAMTDSYDGRHEPPREMGIDDAGNAEYDTCGNSDAFPCSESCQQIRGIEGSRLIQIYTIG